MYLQRKGKAAKSSIATGSNEVVTDVTSSGRKAVKGPKKKSAEFSSLLKDSDQSVTPGSAGSSLNDVQSGLPAESASAPVFTEYQLKQLRAQCLVFLAMRFVQLELQ
jgi:hypothetical protein